MQVEREIARTCPKSNGRIVQRIMVDPATGDHAVYTFQHEGVAWALGGSRTPGALLVLLKYGSGTGADEKALRQYIAIELGRMAIRERWDFRGLKHKNITTAEFLYRFAKTVVSEVLSAGHCSGCEGRCYLYKDDGGVDECTRCGGTGFSAWSNTHRAMRLGIDRKNFRLVWRKRYMEARKILIDHENDTIQRMYERLR